MIELSASTAAVMYLGLTIGFLFGIWTYQHYMSRKKKIIVIERELIRCEYCHFAYLIERAKHVTQCPECHCYNKSE